MKYESTYVITNLPEVLRVAWPRQYGQVNGGDQVNGTPETGTSPRPVPTL